MAFPQSFLEELSARNDIIDVVGSYVPLQSKGGSYWGCCPFHNEKTPSFHVLQDRQMYHCFGCKKGGSVVNFIMEAENLNYPDAIRFLAKRVGLTVPEDSTGEGNALRQQLLSLNRDAALFFYEQLHQPQGEMVREYLAKRRIDPKTAKNFGLGAAPDGWTSLMDAMLKKGYTKNQLLSAGLLVKGKNGTLYDKFRNRLMFPIVDLRGDVLGFGGRVLDKSEPKYMNTPETVVYSKRRVLYGLNLAKKTKRNNFILCEGNIDVVMLHQAGFDNAVASMGTALTPEQIRLLSRYTHELVLCYDNDTAGQNATQKALELLRDTDFSVKVLQLPRRLVDGVYQKQDADDFIKFQGAAAFEALLNGSSNGMEYRMAQIAAQYDLQDDAQKVSYCSAVSTLLATINNAVEREVYAKRAAQTVGVSPDAFCHEVEQVRKKQQKRAKREEERNSYNLTTQIQPKEHTLRYVNPRSALAEEGILRLYLLDDGIFPSELPFQESDFTSPLLGRAFFAFWEQRQSGNTPSLSALTAELSPEEMGHLSGILQKPESPQNRTQALQDYIQILRIESQKRAATEDPLVLAQRKNKEKKGYGGKQNG